jgi:putative ABC transport system permease protein
VAPIGIFGVCAYVVQRTREIGIRMALEARPGQVIGFVLGSNSRLLAAG